MIQRIDLIDTMSDVYPDDSVSQTGNIEERNLRYIQDVSGNIPREINESRTQEGEAVVAERVRSNVREYLQIDEKLNRIQSAARVLRKQKKELQNVIIGDMHALDVENLDLKKGKLVSKKSTPKVPLTKSSIISVLSKHYTDQDFIKHITTLLFDKRDRTEKVSLKHYVKKGDK
jgi:Sec7-like guanine-nucleotide exchange factor